MGKWEEYAIMDVSDFQGGTQPPKDQWLTAPADGYIRMLQIRDFTQARDGKAEYVKQTSRLKTCEQDDILIGRYGASVGKILTGLAGAYNVAIVKALPDKEKVYKPYFRYYLLSPYFQNYILNVGSRAAQAGFNKEDLSGARIKIPDIAVQQQIADVLDRASALIEKRKAQIEKLDLLVKSQFIEMFGDPVTNPKGWEIQKLGDLCDIYRGGSPRPIINYLGGTVPWIKIGDATKGDDIYIYDTNDKIVEDGIKMSRLVKAGSLIFANCGVSLGFARIIKFDGCIHDGWLSLENISENINNVFLLKSLNMCTRYFRDIAPDGTQPNLNTTIMKNFQQIKPPIEYQKDFTVFAQQIETKKSLLQQSLDKLEQNYKSLMQKCFRGEIF